MRAFLLAMVLVLGLSGGAVAGRAASQPLVDAAWLNGHLGSARLVVIDVRSPAKGVDPYAAGHVPGSVSAAYSTFGWRAEVEGVREQLPPLPQIEALIAGLGVGPRSHVVIVPTGATAADFGAATRVYWTFKVLGHERVSILDGGWRAWTAAGLPEDTASPAPRMGRFKARFRPELLADTAEVARAADSGVRLVDARPPAQFSGASIPGAVNVPLTEVYDAASGRFADRATVARVAAAQGVDVAKPAITYCNTGHMGSVDWFALREVLGQKNVKLYDGSMAAWTADPSRPVAKAEPPAP